MSIVTESPLQRRLRLGAVALQILLSVGALAGGLALMIGPNGEILPLPVAALDGSPFETYFWPGAVLFTVLGLGSMAVAVEAWRRARWAPLLTLATGAVLLIWLAVQIAVIGYSSDPPLQSIYIGLGILIAIVGAAWLRAGLDRSNVFPAGAGRQRGTP
jgi:hypothetical protein